MNLNGKISNPGELRTSVVLKRRTVATSAGGFQTPSTTTIATVWAKWTNVHGSETWAANMAQASDAATVLIRYISGVDEACLVEKSSKLYEIVSLDNVQERNEYIELKVKRMVPG